MDELANMSLKEYIVKRDRLNYKMMNGIEDEEVTKKRKAGEISEEVKGEEEDPLQAAKRRKIMKQGAAFLDIGSVSWSMLLATFFLTLHDDKKSFYLSFEGIKEMLEVLKQEFRDFVPFENDQQMLAENAANDLAKFKENQFIELIEQGEKDPLLWKFRMTEKGKKRAKSLCKSIGLVVTVEIDLEDPTTNKITINLYDKDVMPIVDELYYGDSTKIQDVK